MGSSTGRYLFYRYKIPLHTHFHQYGFHLPFRYPAIVPKYVAEKPVRSPHHVIIYLLHEAALNMFKWLRILWQGR
jgi:hypothetical protein